MDDLEFDVLENPRRRRHHRRGSMSALQRKYFGGGRKRRVHRRRTRRSSAVSVYANPRHRRHSSYRVVHRVVRRRNPGLLGGILPAATNVLKEGVIATVGVQVNNLIGNTLSKQVLGVTGIKRSAVKIGTAVALPILVGMFAKRFSAMACTAGAAAIAVEASKLLNQNVYPGLGDLGNSLSTSDETIPAGYVAPASPAPRPFGYNSRVRYPAGTPVSITDQMLNAYVRRLPAGMGATRNTYTDQAGVYDSGPAVY